VIPPRELHQCAICRHMVQTHKDQTFQLVFSRHDWFLTEGRRPGSPGRCPGSLRLVPSAELAT
jgi:hypothetical protein